MSANATIPGEKRGSMRGSMRGRSTSIRVLAMLALALLLAGCGATSLTSGTASSATQTASTTQTVAASSTTATVQATQSVTPVVSATSCSSSTLQTTDVGHPTYILTSTISGRTVTAHVGDTVQVRLPATSRWSFQTAQSASALNAVAPSSMYVPSLNACVWTFQAKATGAETLRYGGAPICKPGQPCAAYRIALDFSVNIV